MDKFVIEGGHPLNGTINISGAKNAVVAIIPATLLVKGPCRIENIPDIKDVDTIIQIIHHMGASVRMINDATVEIDCTSVDPYAVPQDMVRKMRASYYIIGALLGRFRDAKVSMPGGCDFGVRPIDLHIRGFEALGATSDIIENGLISVHAEHLRGTTIYMDNVSVGATINVMLAAVLAEGTTVIENAAKEPQIVDVANFLNSMGAQVLGAGTDIIKISGVKELHAGAYSIIPDQIEAGTYMVAAAAAGGEVLVNNIIPKHMESISAKLMEMGVEIEEYDEAILVRRTGALHRANLKTLPYPGFPTDMQPQMTTLLSVAQGTSTVNESVWDNRFKYINELKRMGANIQVDGKFAVVEGVEYLTGAPVKACDLRAGAAMIIAGLMARGVTEVEDVIHIDRGYEHIVEKLRRVGAKIERAPVCEPHQTIPKAL